MGELSGPGNPPAGMTGVKQNMRPGRTASGTCAVGGVHCGLRRPWALRFSPARILSRRTPVVESPRPLTGTPEAPVPPAGRPAAATHPSAAATGAPTRRLTHRAGGSDSAGTGGAGGRHPPAPGHGLGFGGAAGTASSPPLRGDLLRQGREIAHVITGDRRASGPTSPTPGARSAATARSTSPICTRGYGWWRSVRSPR